jgi:hypothetical protein
MGAADRFCRLLNMSEEVICPECGGVIGASPGGDVKVCTCHTADYHPDEKVARAAEAQVAAEQASMPKVEKICRICGKNLSGHRRIKDKFGYICLACDQDEKDATAEGLVSCGECGRKLKPAGLIDYHGTKICRRCFADHQEISKFKAPPPKLELHDEHEKKRLYILLAVAGVLGIIVLLSALGYIGGGE